LPTIRSRSQIIRFAPLEPEALAGLLLAQEIVADAGQARQLAEYSGGSLARAAELADPELWDFRRQLLNQLVAPRWDSLQLAKSVAAVVDAAGKEAPPRRARLRQVITFAAELYRWLARQLLDSPSSADADLQAALTSAARNWPGDAEVAGACATRCLDALEQIDANANQTTLIECWLDDLAQIQLGRVLADSLYS
jgi:DNA polymerase-3 subunit delta'